MYTLSNSFVTSPSAKCVFAEIQEKLLAGGKKKVLSALHCASRNKLTPKQKAQVFPQIVSMILHESLEVKCAAYSFVLRAIEIDKTLLLLVVNTVLQEIKASSTYEAPTHALRKSLAIDFVSKVRDKEFLSHFYDEIDKALVCSTEIIKKSALLAVPTLYRVYKEANIDAIRCSIEEKSAQIVSSAIYAVTTIEKEHRGIFAQKDIVKCVYALCMHRAEIEESTESFGVLFTALCRLLRPLPSKDVLDTVLLSVPFLPLYAIRELVLSCGALLTPPVAEKIASALISHIGTQHKRQSLETVLLLLNASKVTLRPDAFYISAHDTKKEKELKLRILCTINNTDSVAEIRSFVQDRECTYTALIILASLQIIQEEDIKRGMKCCTSSTLRALYMQHPLPSTLAECMMHTLAGLSSVTEKEAYLYLSGYYLQGVSDEAKRIRRIRNAAGGVLYGKKEEREKAEEHMEEYMYYLLNLYTRGVCTKEECSKHARDAFAEEPYLMQKFEHLMGLPDTVHLRNYRKNGKSPSTLDKLQSIRHVFESVALNLIGPRNAAHNRSRGIRCSPREHRQL